MQTTAKQASHYRVSWLGWAAERHEDFESMNDAMLKKDELERAYEPRVRVAVVFTDGTMQAL